MLKLISAVFVLFAAFRVCGPAKFSIFWLNYQSVKESARATDREREHMTVFVYLCVHGCKRATELSKALSHSHCASLPLSVRLSTCHEPKRVGWVEERETFIEVRTGCACCSCDCREANSN